MRTLITSSVWMLVFVLAVGLGYGWAQTPPVATPAANSKALTVQQVQQATTLRVQGAQLDRDAADAARELEAAALKLTQVRARQQALNQQATSLASTFIVALGGTPGVDHFDFATLALRPRPGKASESDGAPEPKSKAGSAPKP